MMEIQNEIPSHISTATDEEIIEMNKKIRKINLKYGDIVTEFLGPEKTKIFVDYKLRLSERQLLNNFFETIPSENRIQITESESAVLLYSR